jgi:hypothetical protein
MSVSQSLCYPTVNLYECVPVPVLSNSELVCVPVPVLSNSEFVCVFEAFNEIVGMAL